MAGFEKEEQEQEDPISLEKYINKVQDMKRGFGNEVLGE
jgi:hypothetical protein